jgi:hypothetical protein
VLTLADDLITLTTADNMLIALTGKLDRAATPGDLVSTAAAAAAFRDVLRRARFDRVWANRFAKLQQRGMSRLGGILDEHLPHAGGRPAETVDGIDSFPTLDELNISRDYSSECQQMWKIPEEDKESYWARGEGDDPIEITNAGLFRHAQAEDFRRYQAEQAEARAATAESEAANDEDEEEEPIPELPPLPPEPPPPPRDQNPKRDTVTAALRSAADAVNRNPDEALTALRQAARLDKRLETLDGRPGDTLEDIQASRERNEQQAKQFDWLLQRSNRVIDLEDQVDKLNTRDRKRVKLIKELRTKVATLEEENAALKLEIERLSGRRRA